MINSATGMHSGTGLPVDSGTSGKTALEETFDEGFFELRFSPSVALVATVRRFVTEFYAQVLGNADLSGRLAMATHEMLENTVHYSSDGRGAIAIAMKKQPESVEIRIETTNSVVPDRLARAKEALDGVVGASDPNVHYLSLVRRAAKRTDGGSGLGLGRIRAEADLDVSYRVEGDQLTIRVEGKFDLPAAPVSIRVEK